MNRRSVSLILALAATLVAPASRANDIEPGKDKYTAAYTLTPITVDGNLSEWAGVGVIADPKFAVPKGSGTGANPNYVLFEEYAGGTWTGPDDQTSAVQVVYDEDNVYFGFVVTDDYHENSANSAWNGDSIQLMIADGNRSTQVALYNYALGGVEDALGELVEANRYEAGPAANADCDCLTEVAIVRNTSTKKTYYEIKLPAKSLGLTAPLAPGTKFGLGMAINDGDEDTPGQKGWGGLGAHALVFGKSPSETAEVTLGPSETTIEVLGIGTEALLGGDLTDPENDGNEEAGPSDPSWNWVSINSNIEPGFGGGEFSFNIFDNLVGGGNDKWCCDDPTPQNPLWVAVEFPQPVSLSHFTVTSGNDTPDRRPTKWQIQGSNDGTSYVPIFVQDAAEALWTEHNQVIKFTLPMPSVPFRYIRYFVTETPGTLHQLNEIEYFGTFGGSALAYYSGVNPTINGFAFRLTDAGTSEVDPTTIRLFIDGEAVDIGTPTKANGVTDVSYTRPGPFLPLSAHTYLITAKDTVGNNITTEGEWNTAAYALLTAADKVTADTSKPGFIWRVHQNDAFQANNTVRPIDQLKGLLGENRAEPFNRGVAIGDGVAESGNPNALGNLPVRFEIATVINLSQIEFEENGDFTPDDQMPGIPGQDFTDNGIAAEITTYIQLPAGRHVFTVSSDDGFQTFAGEVGDVFRTQLAGQSPGAVATNVRFPVYVEEAGVYPFRTIYEEAGGGAHIELKSEKADGSLVLINDTANGGFPAYRALSGAARTVVSSVTPAPGATGVAFDTALAAEMVDGSAPVDAASVRLTLDGAPVSATASKAGGVTTISYLPPGYLAAGTHSASLTFDAGGASRTETWEFTVGAYGILAAGQQAVSVDRTKPGFLWRVFQNETYTHTSLALTEAALAGNLMNGNTPVSENFADPGAVGVALADGVRVGPLVQFEIDSVINLSQTEFESNGNFPDDGQMPGIPGLNGANDGIDVEVISFVELPAGVVTLGVNSDDGFRTQAGYINVPADGILLGQFDGGRGAADTLFKFLVVDAGVYPLRTIYQEGGGGANIEIFSVKADGTKVLLNDTANGGYRAFRVGVAPSKPEQPAEIAVAREGANVVITFEGTLESATSVTGPWTTEVGATSPSTVSATGGQKFYRSRN